MKKVKIKMGEEKSNETITIKKQDLWKYSTFILVAILIVGAIVFFTGDKQITGNVVNAGNQVPGNVVKAEVSADDDAVLGDKNAPVEIIEFSDYQCPFCARFWSDTLPSIKSEYIDAGKVKLVYRDFPLESIHPMALPAAVAAECVREKGGDSAYFEYHDKIFANQQALNSANLKAWAKELGHNIDSCLDSNKFANEVRKDTSDGSASGVQGTPAFFINGQLVSGAQPFSVFQQIIEAELS